MSYEGQGNVAYFNIFGVVDSVRSVGAASCDCERCQTCNMGKYRFGFHSFLRWNYPDQVVSGRQRG